MENLRELIRDIDKHMRAEWYAGRLPAESWPKSLSDRLAAAVAEKPWPMYEGSAGAIRAVDPDDLKAAPTAVAAPDVSAALDRMDALLDPACGLLTVGPDSATVQASHADMRTIRAALAATPAAAPVVLPEPVPTPCRSMFAAQREYADAMAQHRKNWAEIEAERGMLATGGQAQAVEEKQ